MLHGCSAMPVTDFKKPFSLHVLMIYVTVMPVHFRFPQTNTPAKSVDRKILLSAVLRFLCFSSRESRMLLEYVSVIGSIFDVISGVYVLYEISG